MMKLTQFYSAILMFAALLIPVSANSQLVIYDGPGGGAVDFTFGTFDDGLTETGSSFIFDVNGFGGCGFNLPLTTIDTATSLLRVEYSVLANNVAAQFELALTDNDGDDSAAGLGSEQYFYQFPFSNGSPIDGNFEEQFVPLSSFVFRQQAGTVNDGDQVLNLGLEQCNVQTTFGLNVPTNVEVRRIEIVTTDSASIYDGCNGDSLTFTFGSFDTGLFETGTSFTIDVSDFGGCGRTLGQIDFDADSSQLRVVYQELANNAAPMFEVLLQDTDGDDSGPGLGQEEFIYQVPFANGTPLGDGSGFDEQFIDITGFVFRQMAFGFTNDGDMLLNHGLVQWNLQSSFGATDRLNVEIKSMEIVFAEEDCLLGDVNGDGVVTLLDVGPFVSLITNQILQCEGDINEDGIVDLLDIAPFVSILTGG